MDTQNRIKDINSSLELGKFAVLDNNKNDGKSYLFLDPVEFVSAVDKSDVERNLDYIQVKAKYSRLHAVGFFSYELGYVFNDKIQSKIPQDRKTPLFNVGLFRVRLEVSNSELDSLLKMNSKEDSYVLSQQLNMTKKEYLDGLNKVKKHIFDGDTYQVNYTLKYKFKHGGSPFDLYQKLRKSQCVEFGAFLDFPNIKILSRSPELFFRKEGGRISTKPMKGTIERGATPEEDLDNIKFLSRDEKSRAENVMIVDLLRNDLSRVSKRGSVEASTLFEVQTYETLHQMVSTVSADVNPDLSLKDLFSEIFPCGSITGAPKIRTMELIRELEKEERGVYTGAIGYLNPDNSMCFNVPIRTLVLWPDGTGEMGVGSGVVFDSDPESEYEECQLKARFFSEVSADYNLIECLLFDRYLHHVDLHLDRLEKSVDSLGFEFDRNKIEKDLYDRSNTLCNKTKVRLLLNKMGSYSIDCVPIETEPEPINVIVLAEERTSKSNWLLRHKTSSRKLYSRSYKHYKEMGYYDVIFCNEDGVVTEGSFNNLFIKKDGVWYTSPVEEGLLPGISRQSILQSNDYATSEKQLTVQDLREADSIYLTNAIRGMVKVKFDFKQEIAANYIKGVEKCFS